MQLIVSGSHLCDKFGNSWKQIVLDGFHINEKVDILLAGDTPSTVIQILSNGLVGFKKALKKLSPDYLLILGDRSEAFCIAQVALFLNIKIVHLHGGELSEGSYDDTIRHCLTKMAQIHFPICDLYKKRIIQMGENPKNVFNYGSLGVERILNKNFLSKKELKKLINFNFDDPYFVVCYHNATNSMENSELTLKNIFKSLEKFRKYKIFVSYPNHDNGNDKIIKLLESYEIQKGKKVFLSKYVLDDHFISVLKNSEAIIGNSSSGIIEAPSLKIPTVNVGNRQKGRLRAKSVIDCVGTLKSIDFAVKKAISKEFKDSLINFRSPFERKLTSLNIVKELEKYDDHSRNSFYDLEVGMVN